jgi:hypothetical protein
MADGRAAQVRRVQAVFVQGIDPRDTEWEVERPVYRVYFWHQPHAPEGVAPEHVMFHSDEYRLSGAPDVAEVLDWARTTARPDQTFTLYVEHRHGDSPGLIHLMGVDPTVPT